jgi:perosamine synthetase
MITIYNPDIQKYKTSALDAINSGWISNHGEYIHKSTDKLKEIMNVKHVILMANGTCATHCLFLSIKYKYPSIHKLYVPNNSYVAAYNSALMEYNINQIEVMQIDINTWNINTNEEYIKSLDFNCAVLIVHNLGNIINVPRLKKIRPDIIFVEDNCEGLFGKYNNIYSGTSDDSLCSSISFYGNKIITTGEGGAFITNHTDIFEYINKVYSQGMSTTRYLHDIHAYNYRMTNIEAAFLYDQLNDLDNILNNKEKIFNNYEKLLSFLITENKVKLFNKEEATNNAYWIFGIRIIGNTRTIEETTDFFKEERVDIRPFFYSINKHAHLTNITHNDNNSIILNNEVIMIPSSPNITMEQQRIVVNAIFKFILLNNNIKVININKNNTEILDNFIKSVDSRFFRYFDSRTSKCIENHMVTNLFYDINIDKCIGYTHIDVENDIHWFGIYLDKEYRGKGMGNLFLNYTLIYNELYKNTDCVFLTVDVDNIAGIKLYKKNNFVIYNDTNNTKYYMKKQL